MLIERVRARNAMVLGCILSMAGEIGFAASASPETLMSMFVFTLGEVLVVPAEYVLVDGISNDRMWARAPIDFGASARLERRHDNQRLGGAQAMVFDVFGTVVDWRSGVAREAGWWERLRSQRPAAGAPRSS